MTCLQCTASTICVYQVAVAIDVSITASTRPHAQVIFPPVSSTGGLMHTFVCLKWVSLSVGQSVSAQPQWQQLQVEGLQSPGVPAPQAALRH